MTKKADVLSSRKEKTESLKGTIVGVLIATVLAMAGGGMIGLTFIGTVPEKHVNKGPKKQKKTKNKKEHATIKTTRSKLTVTALPPIVTNLVSPKDTWVRLELAIAMRENVADAAVIAENISQDTLAYVRTLNLIDIEGPSGLAFLRSDLTERAQIRSKDKVVEMYIRSLVVE